MLLIARAFELTLNCLEFDKPNCKVQTLWVFATQKVTYITRVRGRFWNGLKPQATCPF